MARGNAFVVGELARRSTLAGGLVSVRLVAGETNRSRGEARYSMAVKFSANELLGFVVIDDKNGYPEKFKLAEVGAWLAKNLSATGCAVAIEIADASALGVGFKGARLAKRLSSFAAFNVAAVAKAAIEKIASVSGWVVSVRRASVLAAAAAMQKNVALVAWMRGGSVVPDAEPESNPATAPNSMP